VQHNSDRVVLPRIEQISFVPEFIAEAAETVGVAGGDAAAEVKDDVSQFVDLLKVHAEQIPRCRKDRLESWPVGLLEDDVSVLCEREIVNGENAQHFAGMAAVRLSVVGSAPVCVDPAANDQRILCTHREFQRGWTGFSGSVGNRRSDFLNRLLHQLGRIPVYIFSRNRFRWRSQY